MRLIIAIVFLLSMVGVAGATYIQAPLLRCPIGTSQVVTKMTRLEADAHLANNCTVMTDTGDRRPAEFFPSLPPQATTYSVFVKVDEQGIPLTTDCLVFVPSRINITPQQLKLGSSILNRAEATAEIRRRYPNANVDKVEKTR